LFIVLAQLITARLARAASFAAQAVSSSFSAARGDARGGRGLLATLASVARHQNQITVAIQPMEVNSASSC